MNKYSPCVENLRNDINIYIKNPTEKNLLVVKQRIPEYILSKQLTVQLSSEIDIFSSIGQGAYQKIVDLSEEYKNLLEVSSREIDKRTSLGFIEERNKNLIKKEVFSVIDRVATPNNNDYKLAQEIALIKNLDFDGR